ncbi:MAG: hypothetical protein LUG46_00850, partial [Erysipelotrichaceae bacterium]|nr:hypothetical protein [Erysipelotrichaceae bacterium]
MRDSIIKEIIKYKKIYKDIMVLDADCSTSTKSRLFQYSFSNDFINVGIAEQNMIGIASGLSLRGKIPIVNGFSKMLIMRSFEQLHDLIELQNVKIVIIGHYAGLSAGLEGATHHSVNDISLMRNINNLNILTPGNSFDLTQCIDFALKSEIASYIRLSKNDIVNPCSNKIIQKNGFNQEDYIFDDSKKKVIIISVGFSYVQTAKTNEWLNMRKINHSFISALDFQLINYEELSCLIKKK